MLNFVITKNIHVYFLEDYSRNIQAKNEKKSDNPMIIHIQFGFNQVSSL